MRTQVESCRSDGSTAEIGTLSRSERCCVDYLSPPCIIRSSVNMSWKVSTKAGQLQSGVVIAVRTKEHSHG